MKNLLLTLVFPIFLGACQMVDDEQKSSSSLDQFQGEWLFKLNIADASIPFNAVFNIDLGQLVMHIKNSDEEIVVKDIIVKRDSLYIQMPYFNSRFFGKLVSDSLIEGFWVDDSRPDNYNIPFTGHLGEKVRFGASSELDPSDFNGSWKVVFDPTSDKPCPGVGIFKQQGNYISGTVMTETGDHRFLQGNVNGRQINLSCFDGAHAFLYSGRLNDLGNIQGTFWSGKHYTEPWTGERNYDFTLTHPDSLVHLTKEVRLSELKFPDFNDHVVSFGDAQFENKVLIVQVMGSWCPNCLDECVVFKDLYATYKSQGLEIAAVLYERGDDMGIIKKRIDRYKNQLGLNYMFLYGGAASKPLASEHFSMLNEIISFPTAIIIDRKGVVRKIHTGFYGPGTGDHYITYKKDLVSFLETLLNEEGISS